ncbi:hypothetical protein [Chengkuizengella sediminis]|uniref:hypothetical protein n=1 Tax=Chengkuizengella sediminis TaxID=1885917 RepID=UPI001389E246|nr:hypothetical protein [Chengkuizengella sediminis]NDI35094.1 hypothetical protein [Chengkuizengella sediminis]
MFSINVEKSMFLKSTNVVIITGRKQGELNSNVLVEEEERNERYFVKNVVFMEYKNPMEKNNLKS